MTAKLAWLAVSVPAVGAAAGLRVRALYLQQPAYPLLATARDVRRLAGRARQGGEESGGWRLAACSGICLAERGPEARARRGRH